MQPMKQMNLPCLCLLHDIIMILHYLITDPTGKLCINLCRDLLMCCHLLLSPIALLVSNNSRYELAWGRVYTNSILLVVVSFPCFSSCLTLFLITSSPLLPLHNRFCFVLSRPLQCLCFGQSLYQSLLSQLLSGMEELLQRLLRLEKRLSLM